MILPRSAARILFLIRSSCRMCFSRSHAALENALGCEIVLRLFAHNVMPHVSALYIYPVKSCRGVSLDKAVLDERGLLHDRQFLIVDAQDRFLTQRSTPTLARILTALTDDAVHLQHAATGTIRVPWHLPHAPTRTVTIWRDTVLAYDAGDEAAHWLSDTLRQPCRLVTTGEQFPPRGACRPPPGRSSPQRCDAGPGCLSRRVSFARAFGRIPRRPEPPPGRTGSHSPWTAFRPNLVLSGCAEPYAEDTWTAYRIGEARFFSAGPCGRCSGDDHGPANLAARQGTLAHPGGLPPDGGGRGGLRPERQSTPVRASGYGWGTPFRWKPPRRFPRCRTDLI